MDAGLTTFVIPEKAHMKYLGKSLVRSAINEVYIYGSVEQIDEKAFSGISTLQSFYGKNIGDIGSYAFQNTTIKTFTIDGSLRSIGSYAFNGCGALDTVIINSSTPYSIGAHAFDCAALKTIELSDGISTIEEGTFSNCGQLNTVKLPDSLESIEKDAFKNVSSITDISIGEDVKVDKDAFEGAGGTTINTISKSNNKDVQTIVQSKGQPQTTQEPIVTTEQPVVIPTTTEAPAPIIPATVSKVNLKSVKKNKKKTKVTLKWKKLSDVTGYTIEVKMVPKGKKAKKYKFKQCKKLTAKKTSVTLKLTKKQKKLLKKKGTLYYRMRAYKTVTQNGVTNTYYGSYSKTKKVK